MHKIHLREAAAARIRRSSRQNRGIERGAMKQGKARHKEIIKKKSENTKKREKNVCSQLRKRAIYRIVLLDIIYLGMFTSKKLMSREMICDTSCVRCYMRWNYKLDTM